MLGEIYIWKRTLGWVGSLLPYQGPTIQHDTGQMGCRVSTLLGLAQSQ